MYKKGFTLIELLLVVAIIGILSSVILSSLSSARSKGNDSKVRSMLVNLRSAMEIYYTSNGATSYGTPDATNNGCSAAGASPSTLPWSAASITTFADADSYPTGTVLNCYQGGTTWAASAKLSGTNNYICVDSSGKFATTTTALSAGASANSVMTCP